MKIVTIVGARPQFIKAAALSRKIALRPEISETIIHTGQHYDSGMSDIFFKELSIPKPDYYLGIGGGKHGEMTGRQLEAIEKILSENRPDSVLVYGDTNSTLSGALAAAKLQIPVAHVEAGLRSFNRCMPEEINRILTDHIANMLFAPTERAVENLRREGFSENQVYLTGDIMYDAILHYRKYSRKPLSIRNLNVSSNPYILATLHRAENVDEPARLRAIINGLGDCDYNVILPVHPRTRNAIEKLSIALCTNIHLIDPVSYLEIIWLQENSIAIATDSGGIQKEAYCLDKHCITFRNETEWIETVDIGWNKLVGANTEKITDALKNLFIRKAKKSFYGDGNSAEKILNFITTRIGL